jgi:DNA-binding transcriptional LysR family regulator
MIPTFVELISGMPEISPVAVAKSDLVALAPRRLLARGSNQIVAIKLPWLGERFDVSLIWHERTHGHVGRRWIRHLIVEFTADQREESARHFRTAPMVTVANVLAERPYQPAFGA